MPRINNVEIFATGVWNGHTITDADLDAMVDAFNKTSAKVRPHIKLGHDNEQKILQNDGLPAAGWIANLRKKGSKLVADFIDMPDKIKQLVDNKAYRKVSAEVFSNINILGESFPKMLGAVALLGADTPGVMNLDDILAWYKLKPEFEAANFANEQELVTITNEFDFQEEPKMSDDKKIDGQLETLQAENAELKAKLSEQQDEFTSLKSDIAALKEQNAQSSKEILAAKQREKEAKVDAYTAELAASNLISPAMKPFVQELFSDKQEFSVEEKKYDKFGLFKQIMSLSSEFGKLNFSAQTTSGDDTAEDEFSQIKKFAKDNDMDFDKNPGAVYRAFSKSKEA